MEKWSVEKYCDRLQAMKCEAHDKLWLYIEVNAKDFMNECEPGVKNLNSCCKAMLNKMLEGDNFVVAEKPQQMRRNTDDPLLCGQPQSGTPHIRAGNG